MHHQSTTPHKPYNKQDKPLYELTSPPTNIIDNKIRDEKVETLIASLISSFSERAENKLKRIEKLLNDDYIPTDRLLPFNWNDLMEINDDKIHLEIKEQVKKELEKVHSLSDESDFVKYGLNGTKKLRHVIALMRRGICPTIDSLKLAGYGEANYGSYSSAEMLLVLCLKLKKLGYYQSDLTNDWSESLTRCFNSVVRFSPSVSLALYYFYMAKNELPETFQCVLPALIFAIALSLPEDSIIEDVDIENEQKRLISLIGYFVKIGNLYFPKSNTSEYQVFEGVLSSVNMKIDAIERVRSAYNMDNLSFTELTGEEDDLKSILSGVSSISTYRIGVDFSKLAESSMNLREIMIGDVQRCLKHGDSKASRHTVKATDDKLIVFYIMRKGIPLVTNVYKHTTRESLEKNDVLVTIINLCDAILSSVIYGDCTDFEDLCEKMLQFHSTDLAHNEIEVLKETLRVLFIDALPTYEHLLSITKLMQHFSLGY